MSRCVTAGPISFRRFSSECLAEARHMSRHGEAYARTGLGRFYETFRICAEYITPGARVLSVGAGGAHVEKALQRSFDAQVTVIEFPQAVDAHREDYAKHGFRTVGLDLARQWRLDDREPFDLALSLEVLEHLPVAPRDHIAAVAKRLRPGGHLVLSTPNLARLTSVARLLAGRPILHDPELVFRSTSYECEHVHRREYVAAEVVRAIRQVGLSAVRTHYIFADGGRATDPRAWAMRLLSTLNPRFRNIMLFVARRDESPLAAADLE